MEELVKFTLPTHLEALVHGHSHAKVSRCFPLNLDLTASFGTASFCKLRVRKLNSPNEDSEEIQKYELTHFLKGISFDLADI